jgi:hypothetical protein
MYSPYRLHRFRLRFLQAKDRKNTPGGKHRVLKNYSVFFRYVRKSWNTPDLPDIEYEDDQSHSVIQNRPESSPFPAHHRQRASRYENAQDTVPTYEKLVREPDEDKENRRINLSKRVEDIVTTAYDQYQPPTFSKRRLGGQVAQTKFRPILVDHTADYYDENDDAIENDVIRHNDRNINHRLDDSSVYVADETVSQFQDRALSLHRPLALQPYQKQWGRYKPPAPRFAYLGRFLVIFCLTQDKNKN